MAQPSTIDASTSPSPEPAGADRHALLTSISTQLGSRREANWIVDHAGMDGAQALASARLISRDGDTRPPAQDISLLAILLADEHKASRRTLHDRANPVRERMPPVPMRVLFR